MKTRLCFAIFAAALACAQQPQAEQRQIESSDRFVGTAAVQTKSNATRQVPVALRNWSLHQGQGSPKAPSKGPQPFPVKGFLMVQLLAGKVRTGINGATQEWKEGDVWTVPANATMMMEVLGETAVLQTLSVGTPPR
jgi:hypothetical protein